jgi:hypothetical protein
LHGKFDALIAGPSEKEYSSAGLEEDLTAVVDVAEK